MSFPEYPPEWDEPEDDELDFEDDDFDPESDEPDDEQIDRALHDYERKIYGE